MADRKTERLMNLIFTLLVAPRPLGKQQVKQAIADYRDSSDEAFDRKFERDKEELRELGIAVETSPIDPMFDDALGYRIRRDDAELPDLDLTREESAVVGLAAQVWEHSTMAADSATALVKLRSSGVDLDTDVVRSVQLRMAQPRLAGDDRGLATVAEAAARRVPIRFTYARPGQDPTERHLQPWRLLSWRGRWYVGGWDTDREAARLFRLSRVVGTVVLDGKPGDYEAPSGDRLTDLLRGLLPGEPDRVALLSVREGRGQALRRSATSCTPQGDGTDRLEVPFRDGQDLAGEIASHGPAVVVLDPPDLRDRVVERLQAALA